MSDNTDCMDPRSIPLFNKNVYSSNGAVVVTAAARGVMAKNAYYLTSTPLDRTTSSPSSSSLSSDGGFTVHRLSKSEMHSMHCVVDGLRLIHREQSHVKEVLAHCATLVTYGAHDLVTKRTHERQLSCHFILTGSVKVIYEMNKEDPQCGDITWTEELPTQQASKDLTDNSIVYTHGAGEYLAMLSLEGIEDGIAPASKICTLEPTELLRIDTKDFHDRLQRTMSRIRDEIKSIVTNPRCVLSAVPHEALDKILPHITKQRYPPHSDIIKQGDDSSVMMCLAKGRCDVTRRVYVPEARRHLSFKLGSVEQYGVICQECLLQASPSSCTVTTTTQCTVLKINRLALEVVMKDQLFNILDKSFTGYPSDEKLQKIGHQACLWNQFKYLQIKQHLMEVGGQRLLLRPTTEKVKRRSSSKKDNYPENFRRFILKGANFEPVTTRIRSAFIRRPRAQTPGGGVTEGGDVDAIDAVRTTNNSRMGHAIKNDIIDKKSRHDKRRRRVQSAVEIRKKHAVETERDGEVETRSCYVTDDVISSSNSSGDGQRDFVKTENASSDEFNMKVENEDCTQPEPWGVKSLSSDIQYNSNFMRAAVMVTLKTNEIVKKAKAVAEKSRVGAAPGGKQDEDEGDKWYTSIHSEHDRLTREITMDTERMLHIRNYLEARAKQRKDGEEIATDCEQNSKSEQGKCDKIGKECSVLPDSKLSKLTKSKDEVGDSNNSSHPNLVFDVERHPVDCGNQIEDLSLNASGDTDFVRTPERIFKPHNGYNSTERYVIPKTVSPRQSISKETHKSLSSATSVLNSTRQIPSETGQISKNTSITDTLYRVKNSSEFSEQSNTVRPPIPTTKIATKGKLFQTDQTFIVKNRDISNRSSASSSRANSVTTDPEVGSGVATNRTMILSRKAVRVRPVSAPAFNRKIYP